MKVLYITGACLTKNTSANMSHNAFVKGLISNDCEVDIIMASDSWGENDNTLQKWSGVNYFEFDSVSFSDRFRNSFCEKTSESNESGTLEKSCSEKNIKISVKHILKKLFYIIFPRDKIYPLEKKWLKTALKFKNTNKYDLVVSNSSPAASHKLTGVLFEKGRIRSERWIQIWEDPWYYDLYGGHTETEREEEHYLLRKAQEIYYVSPLTLMYQQKYYSDCAEKMKCVPLPYLDFLKSADTQDIEENSFGYFGDYYSVTRNLKPFYEALKNSGYKGYIYGDNDLNLKPTSNIEVSGRVTLDVLSGIQNKTEVLVHLCNLKGGQIPGKIYHYSATKKPILFILDGTEEEKNALREFFGKYDRYYFCENNEKDILATMNSIVTEKKTFSPVTAFSPKEVVKRIIEDEKASVY